MGSSCDLNKLVALAVDTLQIANLPKVQVAPGYYDHLFGRHRGIRSVLRRFGILRYFRFRKYVDRVLSERKQGFCEALYHNRIVAAARLEYLITHVGDIWSVYENFLDGRSREVLCNFYLSSISAVKGKILEYSDVFLSRSDARKAIHDAVAYYGLLSFDPWRNVFRYRDFQFYMYHPVPNAVLYDHGILDADAPRLPLEYDAIFDVGGYIGDSAVVFAQYLSSGGKVYSFEPTNYTKFIETNVRLNGVVDKISIVRAKVGSNADGVALGQFAEHVGLPPDGVYLLKADIEGYERYMLDGARDFISKYHPVLIVAAYHIPDDVVTLIRKIQSIYSGYRFYFRHHQSFSPLIEYYIVAVPDTV